ncbi:MAG TPA: ABC transporter substrate-binding protein, partial [Dehalococcoidia bacterium]|nr:ABC transporter substrate-binding protein [Dehalococcoidia bacterium]
SDQIPVLAKGDLDFATGGWAAAVPNAVGRGLPVKVIADGGASYPGFSWQAITVRKDLYDEGKIRSIADLKGKKVSVTAVQTMSRYFAPLLADAKLTLKDIDFIPLAMPDTLAAYANKSIDAAFQMEPLLSQTVGSGLAVRLKAVSEYRPGFQASVVLASPPFLENKDVSNRWMLAYVKGIRSYLDTVSSGTGVDELITTIAKYTPVKDRAAYQMMLREKTMVGFNPNGYANKDTLGADIEHFLAEGYIKEKVDISSMVDNSLADYAVQRLGKR